MNTAEEIKDKIGTAEELHSVVKTMKALAAVNIRQYEKAAQALLQYNHTLRLALRGVLVHGPAARLTQKDQEVDKLAAVIFGSDQGMCGQLNDLIVRHALSEMDNMGVTPDRRFVVVVGRRAAARIEDEDQELHRVMSVPGSSSAISNTVRELVVTVEKLDARRDVRHVILFFSKHQGGAAYNQHTEHMLPMDRNWLHQIEAEEWPTNKIPLFRMKRQELFSSLVRQYIFVSLFQAMAESLASENASRLAAMQGAEKNISERLDELNSTYHRRRQQAITEELLDIVSGFSALEE